MEIERVQLISSFLSEDLVTWKAKNNRHLTQELHLALASTPLAVVSSFKQVDLELKQ